MANGKLLTILVPEGDADISGDGSFDQVNVAPLPASAIEEPIGEGLLRVISEIDSDFFAFCGSGDVAADGLLLAARFAQSRKCDVVRGLALATNHSGTVGIRGLDLLAAASTQAGILQELPGLLLDLRLENLVIRKSLLLDICSGQEAGLTLFCATDLAARAILTANVLGRMPLVVAREDDRSADESPWPDRQIEIETLPNARDGSRRAFLEAAILFHARPADTASPKAGSALGWLGKLPRQLSAVLSADEKFLVLAAVPDEVYQLHERLSAGSGPVIALRLLRQLILEDAEFEPWLQSALAQVVDIDVAELWRASPVDACILCCIKSGRTDLAAKAAQGEFDPAIVRLLDAQVLEQALSSLYREHSLLNRDLLSHRLGAWHRQIELAKTLRQRPSRVDPRVKQKLHRVYDAKHQLEHQLAVAKRQLMRARLPSAAPDEASDTDSDLASNLEEMETAVQELELKLSVAKKQTFRARRQSGVAGVAPVPAAELEQIRVHKLQVEERLAATRKQLFKARKDILKLQKADAEMKEELLRARRKVRKAENAPPAKQGADNTREVQIALPNGETRTMESERWAAIKKRLDKASRDIKRKDAEAAQLRAAISALETKLGPQSREPS